MKKVITKTTLNLLIVILAFPVMANSQSLFQRTYGGFALDWANSLQQTPDSGYIVLGTTASFGAGLKDFYLLKLSKTGDTIWTKTYGGSTGDDEGKSVVQTADGGYMIAGTTFSFGAGSSDFYIIKTDGAGSVIWSKTYGGVNAEVCNQLKLCSDNGFLMAGYTSSYGLGTRNNYLIRTNEFGDTLWTKSFHKNNNEQADAVQQTSDGGFVLAGFTAIAGMQQDAYLVKTDAAGNIMWAKNYGGALNDLVHSVIQTADGGFCLAGRSDSYGVGASDVYVVRTDANGDTLWSRSYGDVNEDDANSIMQTPDGGFVITGITRKTGAGADDLLFMRIDSIGQLIYGHTIGGISNHRDEAFAVTSTFDGGIALVGYSQTFGVGSADIIFAKADSMGNSGCVQANAFLTSGNVASSVSNLTFTTAQGGIINNPITVESIVAPSIEDPCSPVGLPDMLNSLNHSFIYPNPFRESATLKIFNLLGSMPIQIAYFDLQGRMIQSLNTEMNSNAEVQINLQNLLPGMYMYKVTQRYNNSMLSFGKFIIE